MSVGLPTSTPAFQMAAMYGVSPDIPGFHYHDKRRRSDVYFPRAGDAAWVESTQAAGRRGIVTGGATYGCVFTGGAENNMFSFTMLKHPSGASLLRTLSSAIVLAWVTVKSLVISVLEVVRALLVFVADPVQAPQGWKLLALKIGVSVWVRQLFTLSAARDIYGGAPAVYVNFLDYDIFAHAWGPGHRRAMRALTLVDTSLRQIWRVTRRVPEYRYDTYVLSDHGQAHCQSFERLSGGRRIERLLFEEYLGPAGAHEVGPYRPEGRRVSSGIKALRSGYAPGLVQRFINYLEDDFPWMLGELKEARERDGVRVIAAGPNAFVYFLDHEGAIALEEIEARFPGLAVDIARNPAIGFLLVRTADGPLCFWRGKPYRMEDLGTGPFAGRPDLDLVVKGIRDLMSMPSTGDFVIYGLEAPPGHVTFIRETGAHAGTTHEEMHTFVVSPPQVTMPEPITHPLQLYPHFVRYHDAA
jgi:hypothetical protein